MRIEHQSDLWTEQIGRLYVVSVGERSLVDEVVATCKHMQAVSRRLGVPLLILTLSDPRRGGPTAEERAMLGQALREISADVEAMAVVEASSGVVGGLLRLIAGMTSELFGLGFKLRAFRTYEGALGWLAAQDRGHPLGFDVKEVAARLDEKIRAHDGGTDSTLVRGARVAEVVAHS